MESGQFEPGRRQRWAISSMPSGIDASVNGVWLFGWVSRAARCCRTRRTGVN